MACNWAERKGAVRGATVWMLLTAVGLAGCDRFGGDKASTVPTPPPAPKAKLPVKATTPEGLTPLPSPQQVVSMVEAGRPDPFAPSQGGGGGVGDASQATLPDGFRLTGVIRSGGSSRAFVQIGDQSGPLCPGPRGRCSGSGSEQPLLPPGWSVTGIDAAQGLLAVSFGRQRQVIRLAP